MTKLDTVKYDINKSHSFHLESIVKNLKDTIKIVEFFSNYLMKRGVSTIFLMQGISLLKKRPRFQNFSANQLINRIKNICNVFPQYMEIKNNKHGHLLKTNRNIKLGQIVNMIHDLK